MKIMPYIPENQMRKFKKLLAEEKERKKITELEEKGALQKLIDRTKLKLYDLRSTYGPVEVYAIEFVKLMNKIFKEEKIEIFWFNWGEFTDYITEACLMKKKGKIFLKKAFRERLRDYGIFTKIMRKRGVIKIWKAEPVKRVKK